MPTLTPSPSTPDPTMNIITIIISILALLMGSGGLGFFLLYKSQVEKNRGEAGKSNADARLSNESAAKINFDRSKVIDETGVAVQETANKATGTVISLMTDRIDRLESRVAEKDQTIDALRAQVAAFEQQELYTKLQRLSTAIVKNVITRRKLAPSELAQAWTVPDELFIHEVEEILGTKLEIPI